MKHEVSKNKNNILFIPQMLALQTQAHIYQKIKPFYQHRSVQSAVLHYVTQS